MGQLCVEQRDQVTPRAKGSSPFGRFGFASNARDQKFRNEVANLPEQVQFR
jgi:hypothetical protein